MYSIADFPRVLARFEWGLKCGAGPRLPISFPSRRVPANLEASQTVTYSVHGLRRLASAPSTSILLLLRQRMLRHAAHVALQYVIR